MNSSRVHDVPPTQSLANDLMKGAEEIGKFIGESTRCTYYLLEKGELPAFKQGGVWRGRKTTFLAHYTKLEQPTSKTAA